MHKTLIIDAHVHIYPQFDLTQTIRSSLKNSAALGYSDAINMWLLTERSDCQFFSQLESTALNGFRFEKNSNTAITVKNNANAKVLYILAGRQLVTADNLEVCALATTFNQPDKKLNTLDTIHAVRQAGGVAAINWAPGKWFGDRGKIVQRVFDVMPPDELLISDTTMRPSIWPTPRIMAAAQKRGFRVVRGSDPLPFAGEEKYISSYATLVKGEFDSAQPEQSLISILTDPSINLSAIGRRSGPFVFMQRQKKIMTEKVQ